MAKGELTLQTELRLLTNWSWDGETNLDCSGGPNVNPSPYKREARESERLALKMEEEATNQGRHEVSENGKETNSCQSLQKGTQPCLYFGIGLGRPILHFWPSELWEDESIKCVVICYNSHRKQIEKGKKTSGLGRRMLFLEWRVESGHLQRSCSAYKCLQTERSMLWGHSSWSCLHMSFSTSGARYFDNYMKSMYLISLSGMRLIGFIDLFTYILNRFRELAA